jgi:hypothetical protein
MAPGESAGIAAAADLAPASIRAAALSALVFAAAGTRSDEKSDGLITAGHIHRAVAREFEKSGRTWTPSRKATP